MKKHIIGASAAAVLALTGCGGTGDTPSTNANQSTSATTASGAQQGTHNDSDIAFAQQMIPHHEQAVEMANLALDRSTSPVVKDLAERIKGAQDPEIQQLVGLLTKWGAPLEADELSMRGMDHDSMSGMMSANEMEQLKKASGSEFDVMWMQMMIEHHQGAIDMAEKELSKGSNAEATALAERIIEAQEAEIREMNELLPQ